MLLGRCDERGRLLLRGRARIGSQVASCVEQSGMQQIAGRVGGWERAEGDGACVSGPAAQQRSAAEKRRSAQLSIAARHATAKQADSAEAHAARACAGKPRTLPSLSPTTQISDEIATAAGSTKSQHRTTRRRREKTTHKISSIYERDSETHSLRMPTPTRTPVASKAATRARVDRSRGKIS